ncbi:MAG: sulfotransferase [Solirubrobacterales bacterium]
MLPNFFVIGAGQSGTTSLHRYLYLHPEIHVPVLKEPNFFCREEDGPWPFGRIGERSAYELLYDTKLGLRGDCSPSYSQDPLRRGVPRRIAELVPGARHIYLVRDPIERILAHYVHDVSSSGEQRPLADALGDLGDPENPYLVGSSYAHQLERYREHFPEDRILVVDSADLKDGRAAALRQIFAFLGADPGFTSPGFEEELNVGSAKRAHAPGYAGLRDSRIGDAWRRFPGAMRRPLSGAARRAAAPKVERPALDQELRAALAERLAPQAARLRKMTGLALSSWSV